MSTHHHIPEISFLRTRKTKIGFEIMRLSELFARAGKLGPLLEQPHRVTYFQILFITAGTGRHHIDFQSYTYQKSSMLFISKGQVHAFEIRPDVEGFILLFEEAFLLRNLIHPDKLFFYKLYDSSFG